MKTTVQLDELASRAFNTAIKLIQDELGVTTGDFAGTYFAGTTTLITGHLDENLIIQALGNYAFCENERIEDENAAAWEAEEERLAKLEATRALSDVVSNPGV